MTPSSGRSVCWYYTVTIKATRQQHMIVDDQLITSIWCYHSTGLDCSRPILLLLAAAGWPAALLL